MPKKNATKLIPWLPTTRGCNCPRNAMNCLSKNEWLRNQVPIWWFNTRELHTKFDMFSRKRHPAVFPSVLAKRIITNYTHENETILDPFSGVGTTLYAAQILHRNAIGFELNKKFTEFTNRRLKLTNDQFCSLENSTHRKSSSDQHLHQINTDSRELLDYIPKNSINMVFTSPPYWDLLKQQPSRRNLKNQKFLKKNYSDDPKDLSNNQTFDKFSNNIEDILGKAYQVLKPGGRCVINTADYRRKGKYISLSGLYIQLLQHLDFELKNVIIWDRRREYDIGLFSYPRNFIVNNGMFEYILEFQK